MPTRASAVRAASRIAAVTASAPESPCVAKKPEQTTSSTVSAPLATGRAEIARDDAERAPQLERVPSLAPEDAHARRVGGQRMQLAREDLEQRRLAAAVRADDRERRAGMDGERHVVECDAARAHDGRVTDVEERRRRVGARPVVRRAVRGLPSPVRRDRFATRALGHGASMERSQVLACRCSR